MCFIFIKKSNLTKQLDLDCQGVFNLSSTKRSTKNAGVMPALFIVLVATYRHTTCVVKTLLGG